MGVWVIVLISAMFLFRSRLFPTSDYDSTGQAQIQTDERSAETHAPPSLTGLVGQWRRTDADYILDIKAVHDDGKIDVEYLNPRSINISKAEAITKGGFAVLAVTLQDRGYPGNMYTLTYDPDADHLEGVYHHRGLGQQFDVEFTRFEKNRPKGNVP